MRGGLTSPEPYDSPITRERWDRRERGETPETFKVFGRTIYEQQLEIDKFKRKAAAIDEAVDLLDGCLDQKAMPDEKFDQQIEAFLRRYGGMRDADS